MLHYEQREGYERAGLYIQCRPVGKDYLAGGSYLQTDQGQMMSPLMPTLVELFPWIRMLGWEQVEGIAGGLVYERKQLDVPDACYLGQTDLALATYDEAMPFIEERWLGDLGQMQAADAEHDRQINAVREAYARDTADRNSRAQVYRLDPGKRYDGGYLRRAVEQWRATPDAQRGLWFLFTCQNSACSHVGRVVGSGRLEASGPKACPQCHELTTYRGRSNQ